MRVSICYTDKRVGPCFELFRFYPLGSATLGMYGVLGKVAGVKVSGVLNPRTESLPYVFGFRVMPARESLLSALHIMCSLLRHTSVVVS